MTTEQARMAECLSDPFCPECSRVFFECTCFEWPRFVIYRGPDPVYVTPPKEVESDEKQD